LFEWAAAGTGQAEETRRDDAPCAREADGFFFKANLVFKCRACGHVHRFQRGANEETGLIIQAAVVATVSVVYFAPRFVFSPVRKLIEMDGTTVVAALPGLLTSVSSTNPR
jgi:hypothetical protein